MIKNLEIYERSKQIGNYIVENKTTIRNASKIFGLSKSTVHKDVTERIDKNSKLYKDVREVLNKNKEERASRGGEATRQKYLQKKKNS